MKTSFFSDKSNVSLVITSCGRLDLLEKTLISLFNNNTYPIKKLIIIEDSGDDSVLSLIPDQFKNYCSIIVNTKKLGQIKSIDKAYSLVDTDYIFHCEDDWEFYREGFVEDSLKILEDKREVYQVWLRSFYHDIKKDYPFHSLGEKFSCNGIMCRKLLSLDPKWQGFSFNPGLRRKADYLSIKGGYSAFLDESNSSSSVESALSSHMISTGMYAVVLDNDAVAHTGYGHHIQDNHDKKKRRKKNNQKILLALTVFSAGLITGLLI